MDGAGGAGRAGGSASGANAESDCAGLIAWSKVVVVAGAENTGGAREEAPTVTSCLLIASTMWPEGLGSSSTFAELARMRFTFARMSSLVGSVELRALPDNRRRRSRSTPASLVRGLSERSVADLAAAGTPIGASVRLVERLLRWLVELAVRWRVL